MKPYKIKTKEDNTMPERKNKYCYIPELDFSWLEQSFTNEECEKAAREVEQSCTHDDLLKFVEDVESHPEHLSSWDADVTFDEFARKVKTGEHN